MNIIQDNNWVITTKKDKGKLSIFRGNLERVIPIYAISHQDCCATVDGEVSCDLHDLDGICVVPAIKDDYTVNRDSDETSSLVYARR